VASGTRSEKQCLLTWGNEACPRSLQPEQEGTFCLHTTGSRPRLVVSSDGRGMVSHAESRLLADLPDVTGLTGAFADALRRLRPCGTGQGPGRALVDLAVMLSGCGETITAPVLLCGLGLFRNCWSWVR